MKSKINILYITKLKKSMANGVTIAVSQLLNSISNYANVGWVDLGGIDIEVNDKINKLNFTSWRDFNADIAVFEDPFNSIQFCKMASVFRKEKIPYVLSPHGCFTKIAMQKKALKKYIAIHTIFNKYLKGCYATQYLCENERTNSLKFNKELILPNGIPLNDEYDIKKKIRKIVFVSRKDIRHKGIDYLLDAVCNEKSFLREHDIKIELYGSIESEADQNYIIDFIQKNDIGDLVFNNGPVFGSEKVNVLLKSDLFVLTSRHEGFPMSILEALSYGLPVLVTKGTNMDDIVEEYGAGWTCETDVDQIAMTLKKAIKSEDCTQISKNARQLSEKYSWDSVSQQTIVEYEKVILNHRGGK